ncbi:MAG: response regulator [Candidatus Kapabacteria bacterium]|nr:response regulator [Candidatus Kapabacteria bacterium]
MEEATIKLTSTVTTIEGKVLVVDDQQATLRIIKKHLIHNNYSVEIAENGTAALELAFNQDFDVVILDVMMPGMSGYEVCRKIREKYSLFELPVMFLTAKDDMEELSKGFEVDGNDFLSKPFDITELLARIRTFVKLRNLTHSNKALQSAIELKNQILQISAHDIKNPLTSIMVLSTVLAQEFSQDSDSALMLTNIQKSCKNILHIVEELLLVSRIESGKLILDKTATNFNLMIRQGIENSQPMAIKKNQTFHIDFTDSNPVVFADNLRLSEIIDNIISNAVKYSDFDKSIYIRSGIIQNGSLHYARLEVQDEGPGLSSDDMTKVFGKFQKLSARPTGGESSSGLGLSIAKALVEAHGGRIWVESIHGSGATFFIDLPIKKLK